MALQTFIDGQILASTQLNLLQAGLLQANSPTPLILTGNGTQLTVAGSASMGSLLVGGNTTSTTLTITGSGTVPSAPLHDNSNLIASTSWVNTAISTITGSGIPYSPSSIAETGGTINGVTIGLTVPAAATFTSAQANTPSINDNSTHVATTAFVLGQGAVSFPLIDGTATIGTSTLWARQDHVHPVDTTRAPLASPTFTGNPAAPTQSSVDVSTRLATTAFVANAISGSGTYVSSAVNITGGQINNTTLGATTPSTGSFSQITNSGAEIQHLRVVIAAGSITQLSTDRYIIVNKTSGAATAVALVSSPTTGQLVTIKDGKGDAATNNITITPFSGNIDGTSSFVINVAYGSVDLMWTGAAYSIL